MSFQSQESRDADLHTAFELFGYLDGISIAERLGAALIGILSTPWRPCLARGCTCGCLFCPFCGCHMNNIEEDEDGHLVTCPWAWAAVACGLLGGAP